MLRNPCKLCLVRPSCSLQCNEKIKWETKKDWVTIPFVLVFCLFAFVILLIISAFLMLLNGIGLLSNEKYYKLDPFIEFDKAMDKYNY